VVFDVPDFPDVRRTFLTSKHDVELAGFAVEVNTYPSMEALKEAQPEMSPLVPPAFIPAGMVSQVEGDSPTAHALLVGNLLASERVTNALTGREFLKMEVETPAGPMALVADPALLPDPPETGSVVQVGVWLSGRLVPEAEADSEGEGLPGNHDVSEDPEGAAEGQTAT
jgi:hypothetical protein